MAPLWGSWLLYATDADDDHNGLFFQNVVTGESYPWYHDWWPQNEGWEDYAGHPVLDIVSSPNGQWVAYMVGVTLPADQIPEEYPGMSSCEVILLAQADGTHARTVGLSILVGSGPHFDFTSDGRCIIGTPFLDCVPDAKHYVEFLTRDPAYQPDYRYNEYCISTGVRKLIPSLDIGDGFWKCPYSNNYRIENNWYDEHRFSNLKTGELLGEYTLPDGISGGMMHGWVLPDAVLITSDMGTGLLYVDGTYVPTKQGNWEVYCWLPDGTYLFSDDGGKMVKHGKVDWPSFTVDWWVDHPELVELQMMEFHPLHESDGVVIHDWGVGSLHYLPLSREGAKP